MGYCSFISFEDLHKTAVFIRKHVKESLDSMPRSAQGGFTLLPRCRKLSLFHAFYRQNRLKATGSMLQKIVGMSWTWEVENSGGRGNKMQNRKRICLARFVHACSKKCTESEATWRERAMCTALCLHPNAKPSTTGNSFSELQFPHLPGSRGGQKDGDFCGKLIEPYQASNCLQNLALRE